MDLAEFLLARIAEDEDWAKEIGKDFLRRHGPGLLIQEIDALVYTGLNSEIGVSRRVLAECDAKRRIVEAYRYALTCRDDYGNKITDVVLYDVLWFLAQPYRDHPDFHSDDWHPDNQPGRGAVMDSAD